MTTRTKPTITVSIRKTLDDRLSLVNNKSGLVDTILSEILVNNRVLVEGLAAICGGVDYIPWTMVITEGLQNTYNRLKTKKDMNMVLHSKDTTREDEVNEYIETTLMFNGLSIDELKRWYYLSFNDHILQAIRTKSPLTYFEMKDEMNL